MKNQLLHSTIIFFSSIIITSVQALGQTQIGQDILGEVQQSSSGFAISMPDDSTIVIASPDYKNGSGTVVGAVEVFSWDGSSWGTVGSKILGANEYSVIGYSVSMPDAHTFATGSPRSTGFAGNSEVDYAGSVKVFHWTGSNWTPKGSAFSGNGYFGALGGAVSMPDSNTLAIGSPGINSNSGKVEVYAWDGNNWILKGTEIAETVVSASSGVSVHMPDPNTVAIGAPTYKHNGVNNVGKASVYQWNGTSWAKKGSDIIGTKLYDEMGRKVFMPDGNTLAISAPFNQLNNRPGYVVIHQWDGNDWALKGDTLKGDEDNDRFGSSISMPTANYITIGAPYANSRDGEVKTYSWDGTIWNQIGDSISGSSTSQMETGWSVSMPDTNTVGVAGPRFNFSQGSVGIFELTKPIPFGGSILSNGCISCDSLNVGDLFQIDINGVTDTFTVVDRALLLTMFFNQEDLSKVCVSKVTDMSGLFQLQANFNDDISRWDVSHVTNMDQMFAAATSFNQDIGSWDVDSVTTMEAMFYGADRFNQDIGSWDVKSVVNMKNMLANTDSFNQDLGSWSVGSVTDMSYMFENAISFNGDVGNWSVDSVTTMKNMFKGATAFNQDIGSWDVSKVAEMSSMFDGATSFNQDISGWCVGKIATEPTDFADNGCPLIAANKPLWGNCNPNNAYFDADSCLICDDYSVGDVFYIAGVEHNVVDPSMIDSILNAGGSVANICASQMTDVSGMFRNRSNFNEDIGSWDMSNVTNSEGMFENALSFNQDISNWDMSSVTLTRSMFAGAQSFNQDIGDWDVSGVTNMRAMFNGAHSFNQDLSDWDVSNCINMSFMFANTFNFNQNINSWDVSSVEYMQMMFTQARVFNQPLNSWNTSNVTTMRGMFFLAQSFSQDLSSWCVGNNMNRKPKDFDKASIFGGATLLTPAQSPAWGVPCISPLGGN